MTFKKMIAAVAAAIMVSASGAADYYDPCCEPCPQDCGLDLCCDPCSGFYVYADYLYWKARRCDIPYAVPFDNLPDVGKASSASGGKVHSVGADYDSGFRIGVFKDCGCVDFGVEYTRLHTQNKNKTLDEDANLGGLWLSSGLVSSNIFSLEFASGKYEIDYDVVNVEVGYALNVGTCVDTRVFGGFKYASINQEIEVDYVQLFDDPNSNTDFITSKVDMDAYGIYLGADASYAIFDCIDLFGSFSYAALAGNFDRHLKNFSFSTAGLTTEGIAVDLKDECWQFVSNLNLSLGLEYNLNNCFCADWAVAVGYEFHHYFCLLDFLNYQTGNGLTINDKDACLGFDGLFVRLSASF